MWASHCNDSSCCGAWAPVLVGFSSCGSQALVRGLSSCDAHCSVACGIFLDQGLNLCPLLWQADFHTLHHQEKSEAKVAQLCPTLCNPMDYTVHGILQARILEWVVIPFSRGSFQPGNWTQVPRIAGGFFTSWAPREAPSGESLKKNFFFNLATDVQSSLLNQKKRAGQLSSSWFSNLQHWIWRH